MGNEAKIKVTVEDKATQGLKSIGDKAKAMRGSFLAVGAAGAAVVGALALSIKSFAKAGDEIQKMSLRTGISTVALSELKFALEQSGSSVEGFEKGIRRMSSFIQDGRDGMVETVRALDSLGLSVSAFEGLSPEKAFDVLSGALAGVDDKLTQAALAQDIFGRSGTALLPLLAQGADGIAKLREEAHELGIVFDQDAANAAARLVDAQNTLAKSFDGVKFAIAENLVPAISPLLEGLGEMVSKISAWAKENPVLTKTVIALAGGVGVLAIGIAGIGLVLPVMATGLGLVTVGFIGLNVATGGLLIGIGLLVAGIVLLATNWDVVVEALRKGANVMLGGVEAFVNGTIRGLNTLVEAFNSFASVFGITIGTISEVELPRWAEAQEKVKNEIIEDNEAIQESYDETGDSVEELARRSTEAAEQMVKSSEDRWDKIRTVRDQELAHDLKLIASRAEVQAENEAISEAAIATALEEAEAIVAASAKRFADLKEQRAKDLQDWLDRAATRSDAIEALKADNLAAFEAIRAEVALLPANIQVGGGLAGGLTGRAKVRASFKASQGAVEDELAAARAKLSGLRRGFDPSDPSVVDPGRIAAIERAERNVARLIDFMGSDAFKGVELGKLFAPPGGFGSGGPPMIGDMKFREGVPGVVVIFEGDVFGMDDFDDRVQQALANGANEGITREQSSTF